MISWLRSAAMLAAFFAGTAAHGQNRPTTDRSDPAVIERELERPERETPHRQQQIDVHAPAEVAGAADIEVVVSAIRVTGVTRLPQAAFSQAIQPYLGRALDQEALVRLATDVAGVLRSAGYGLATAWVPAQDVVGGLLTVEVDEGRIDSVRATGPGARLVEQRLRDTIGARPVLTAELERQLLVIGDMAGVWIGDARLIRENGRNVLAVATRYEHVHALVRIDNWGSEAVGPVRAWAEIGYDGLARAGDSLTFGAAVTPLEPEEFQFAEAHYRLPVGGSGTMIGIGGYVGHTRVEDLAAGSPFEGDSSAVQLDASHPLVRSRDASLWLTAQAELRDSDLDRAGVPLREDRVASLSLALYGTGRFAGGRLRGRVALVQGFDLFGATGFGDPLASRSDAGGVFTKLESWAEYVRPLGGAFSLALATRSQFSDGPLLSSEEMGLGGPQFLRAFDYREASGDEGAAASAELRFDLKNVANVIDTVRFYTYIDAGSVRDHSGPADELASAGGGVRLRLAKGWDLEAELGIPLTDGTRDADPGPRFSFSITARF